MSSKETSLASLMVSIVTKLKFIRTFNCHQSEGEVVNSLQHCCPPLLGFFPQGGKGAPPEAVCPLCPPEIWSNNNRQISITKEICIAIDFALLKKIPGRKTAAAHHCSGGFQFTSYMRSHTQLFIALFQPVSMLQTVNPQLIES